MISLLIFILALVVLYLLSRIFIQKLFVVLYRFTRSEKKASYLLALIFLPGTFIHEISHFLAALFLLVPVGELNLVPEYTGNGVRLGSVAIGRTDLIRNSTIGIAPFIVGSAIILGLVSYAISADHFNPVFISFVIFVIFQITHTMFSSKKDLHAVVELSVLLIIVISLMFIFNFTQPFIYLAEFVEENQNVIQQFAYYLFVPIGLEFLLLLLFNKTKI